MMSLSVLSDEELKCGEEGSPPLFQAIGIFVAKSVNNSKGTNSGRTSTAEFCHLGGRIPPPGSICEVLRSINCYSCGL